MKLAVFAALTVIALIIWSLFGRYGQARAADSDEPSTGAVIEYRRQVEKLALPAAKLIPMPAAPITANGSRLGGPVWLQDKAQWPKGPDGRPLEFVAQINFADIPPLPDYPTKGLLQLFVGRDDLYGADFDAPERGNFKLVWLPEGAIGEGQMVAPSPLVTYGTQGDDGFNYTPFDNDTVRANGIMLKAEITTMQPPPMTLPTEELIKTMGLEASSEIMEKIYDSYFENKDLNNHHIGGHPVFVQSDFRSVPATSRGKKGSGVDYTKYDRVLFRLTSDDNLMWGDTGEAVVMIKRHDLIARDFSQAVWWWDCS